MAPLLFIFLISIALLLVLYWLLSSIDSREKNREAVRERHYDFEASQELFKFVRPTDRLKKDEQQEDK